MNIVKREKLPHFPILYNREKISFGRLTSSSDILMLFKTVFNRDFKQDLIDWFNACPTGSNRWYAAFENGEPLGMYGLLPIKIRIGRNIYSGALCNNVGVIPRFYGTGLFQSLGQFCLKDSNFPIVVCVSNLQAARGHKLIGWERYGVLELLSVEVGKREVDFVSYPQFRYLARKTGSYFHIDKDADFLKWRYSKPNEEYFQSFFENNSYAIWKNYQGRKQILEISDFNCIFKLSGTVDIWQFQDTQASLQLKNNNCICILANEFLIYTGLSMDRDANLYNFEPGDNDVF